VATVRDYVKANLGETYDKLTDVALYDGQTKPDVVGLKIEAALARFDVVEGDLNAFGLSFIGDFVTRTLVPIAIDYYMVQTRLVDNASRPAGVTPLGGEVGQNYNRIAALQALDQILAARLASDYPLFASQNETSTGFGIVVSTHSKPLNTQDPWDAFDPITDPYHGPIGYEIGGVYVVRAG
jgi:hypothetical protein